MEERQLSKIEFEGLVRQRVKKLNRLQAVSFTWLSAASALPFLGGKGNFDFWRVKKQRHLNAVFQALDVAYSAAASAAYDAANDAAKAANDANEAAKAANDAATNAVYAAVYAAYYAAYEYAASPALASASAAADAASTHGINLQKTLFTYLDFIENNQPIEPIGTGIYGQVWDNFMVALEKEGCIYYGRLYEKMFKNGFVVDEIKLAQRLNVPKEIRALGAAKVAKHLEQIEQFGAEILNEARIIILGEKGAGKTCLARRLANHKAAMTKDGESTAGVDTSLWRPAGQNMNVHIWDFAGHTVTHAVHKFFLSERCLYVVVYDGRTEERNRLEYWLDQMKNYGGGFKSYFIDKQKRWA